VRIGLIFKPDVANVHYRAVSPMSALARRGHEVAMVVQAPDNRLDYAGLRDCDVVHVYRCADERAIECVEELRRRGIGVTWDNDDDFTTVPEESPNYPCFAGANGQRQFDAHLRMMRRADVVTTTSERLANRFRAAGIRDVTVIENYLESRHYARAPRRHEGIVVGWIAGVEHYADALRLDIAATLRRIQARDRRVRVESIGVQLALDPHRYRHDPICDFERMPGCMRQFDIGIAPLADIPMSYNRSSVKVKEYAAAGIPWVATRRGPYAQLGPRQGGLAVEDDEWEAALWSLVSSRLRWLRLARKATAWGRSQHIDLHAHRWEAVMRSAIEKARRRPDVATVAAVSPSASLQTADQPVITTP
jgi:glycosyltransferase involved in cell wall biosynthesis